MNKSALIIVLALVLVLVGAGFYFNASAPERAPALEEGVDTEAASDESAEENSAASVPGSTVPAPAVEEPTSPAEAVDSIIDSVLSGELGADETPAEESDPSLLDGSSADTLGESFSENEF